MKLPSETSANELSGGVTMPSHLPPEALDATPCTGADPWLQHMRCGRFEEAWQISDEVVRQRAGVPCYHLPRHEQYFWDGSSLAGKRVLVRCYHGLGDTIQFIRYAPLLRGVVRQVIVWAQPELLALLQTAAGMDRLLPLHDGTPEVEYDADVELMELPHAFRTTAETLPCTVPYLHVAAAESPVRDRAIRRVGLVWQSGGWDDRRSVPTELLRPLAEVRGVRLVVLQQGPALEEWTPGWGEIGSTPDPLELARRMRALDLVISVDSFPAHLAGALAVPTWTLLHSDPDWRWMLNRDDTPWYPTMRLWRQPRPGDWESVINRVATALRQISAPEQP